MKSFLKKILVPKKHKPNKRFGKRKHLETERLLRGEFFKFFRSAVFKASAIILTLSIVLTIVLYGTSSGSGSLLDLISSAMNGNGEIDIFTMIDGIDSDLLSVASEFGVSIPTAALDMLDEYYGTGSTDALADFLTTDPKDYYAKLNPAKNMTDALRAKGFSEELIEYIQTDRNFLKLIVNSDTLMRAVQDFSQGKPNSLTDDVFTLLENNEYYLEIYGAGSNLAAALSKSFVVSRINRNFASLKDPELNDNGYTLEKFYIEYFTALFGYGNITPTTIDDAIFGAYEQTGLCRRHGVSSVEFFLAVAPGQRDLKELANEIYISGIFQAIAHEPNLALIDFAVNVAVSATAYRPTEEEINACLPAIYFELADAGELTAEEEAAYIEDATAEARFEHTYAYILEYMNGHYKGFYSYLKTLPLFDAKSLAHLVPDPAIQSEIFANQSKIFGTYIDIISSLSGDTKALTAFVLYFVAVGDVHQMLYDQYMYNMTSHFQNLLNIKAMLNFFENDGAYGKSSADFLKSIGYSIGEEFEKLLTLLQLEDRNDDDQADYLEELTEVFESFSLQYMSSYQYMRAGEGIINYAYFPSKNSTTKPDGYRLYENQYRRFLNNFNKAAATLISPAKSIAIKIETIRKFAVTLMDGTDSFFAHANDTVNYPTREERMKGFSDIVDKCYTAVITKEFYEENYAIIAGQIDDALSALFRVYKDEDAVEVLVDGDYFDRDTVAKYIAIYEENDPGIKLYDNLKYYSRIFTRKATLVADYVPNIYLAKVALDNGLNDKALSKIYGMLSVMGIGITKYSIQRDAQKDLFFFNNIEQYTSLTDAMSLDNGYGFMQFGIGFIYLFIMLITVVIAAATIAGEYETGSVKLLLIRPFRRRQFITAKLLYVGITLFAMFLISFLVMLFFGAVGVPGAEGLKGLVSREVLVIFNAQKTMIMSPLAIIAIEYLLYFVSCFMYACIAVMVSTIFKSRAASVAVSVFVFFASSILTALLSSNDWYKYIIFNNTDWFIYLSTGPSLADMTFGFSVIVYFVYLTVILGATYIIFEKRDAV
ncbi:MAG: ABC transporter permease [Clostridiales bacterium]|jgi:ABC-2 type transport system permease protein|nr:ABC transporter permease [Clostridiales bacterium]